MCTNFLQFSFRVSLKIGSNSTVFYIVQIYNPLFWCFTLPHTKFLPPFIFVSAISISFQSAPPFKSFSPDLIPVRLFRSPNDKRSQLLF